MNDVTVRREFFWNLITRCGVAAAFVAGALLCGTVQADPLLHYSDTKPKEPTVPAVVDVFPSIQLSVLDEDAANSGDEYLVQIQLAQLEDDDNDPLEGFNRTMFAFNEVVYSGLLGPAADVYNVLPSEARTMVSSFFTNLKEPLVFLNDLLQGEIMRAMDTFTRFALNSTFGFGGIADVATAAGIPGHDEDFGQTLAIWGVDEGFYLVLPILGPSNPRDAIGQYVVDTLMDPVNIYLDNHDEDDLIYARAGAAGFTEFASVRDDLVSLKKNSIDYYAAIRSLYRQRRAADISNGIDTELPAIPDFEFSDFPEFDEPEPALGDTKEPTEDSDGELSQLTQLSEQPYGGDPFVAQFQPVYGPNTDSVANGLALEGAWHADVRVVTGPR